MRTGFRLPLQIGTSSLEGLARAASTIVPGVLLIGSIAGPVVLEPWDEALSTYGDYWFGFLIAVLFGYPLIHYGVKHLALSVSERPSDIVLDDAGLRVEGGPQSKLAVAWSDLDDCEVVGEHDDDLELIHSNEKEEKTKANIWRLVLKRKSGRNVVLATAEEARERASLEALRDSIRASLGKGEGTAGAQGAKEMPSTVLRCPSCGAPAELADEPRVACMFCHAPVDVPADLRARCRAVTERAASRAKEGALLKKLLRQPGALRTEITLGFAAVPMLLAWPVAGVVAVVLYVLCYLHAGDAVLLALATFAVVWAFFYLVRGQLTDRQALRLLTLQFAARAPERPGAPPRCRQCSAPITSSPGSVLAHCPYCDTDNVLGLDPRGEVRASGKQVATLEGALRDRNREHARHRGGAITAIALLAVAWFLVLATLKPAHALNLVGDVETLERISYDPLNEFNPRISPDGHTLLYDLRPPERHDEEREESIMTMESGGGFRGTELTREKLHAIRPVWLPNGKGYLFVSWPSEKASSLWRVDSLAPYATPTQVATTRYDMGVPQISADGSRVVYARQDKKKGAWNVVTTELTPNGKTSKPLALGFNPTFNPAFQDGSVVVYTHTVSGVEELHELRTARATSAQLTHGTCDLEDPLFSPDGAWLLVLRHCPKDAKSAWGMSIMRPDGTGEEHLTEGDVEIETPSWHGDYVYFSANVAGNFDIWRVHLRGKLAGHGHPSGHPKS